MQLISKCFDRVCTRRPAEQPRIDLRDGRIEGGISLISIWPVIPSYIEIDPISHGPATTPFRPDDSPSLKVEALRSNKPFKGLSHPPYLLTHRRPARPRGPPMITICIHSVLLREWVDLHLGRDLPCIESETAI